MGYTAYIITFLLGLLSSILYFEWKNYRQNRDDLKALLVLAYVRISVFTETLRMITEESQSIYRHCPPSLGMDTKQIERLFVLGGNKKIMLFLSRVEIFCWFCQSLDKSVKIPFNKQSNEELLQDCEQCLKNIYTIFEKEFSSREAVYYLCSDETTDHSKHIS